MYKRQVTALVGPSGSGKSTIAKLIAGFWDVTGGSVALGGVNLRKIPLEQLNRQIAYVSQDNYLFDRTVRDNIRMGRLNATIQNSAVTLAAPVLLAFNAVNNLFGVGSSSLMSRSLGCKDYDMVDVYKRQRLSFPAASYPRGPSCASGWRCKFAPGCRKAP